MVDILSEVGLLFSSFSIIITLILGFFAIYLSQKKEIGDLMRRISGLSKQIETSLQPSNSRNISNDLELLKSAQMFEDIDKILVLGVNSLGVVHQGYENIISLMSKKGLKIQILLLDPGGSVFDKRINSESSGKKEIYDSTRKRLISEWNATMMILSSISDKTSSECFATLKVKKHNEFINIGFTGTLSEIQDTNSRLFISKYPTEGRGYSGKHFICRKSVDSERYTFKAAVQKFEEIWDEGIPVLDYDAEIIDLKS